MEEVNENKLFLENYTLCLDKPQQWLSMWSRIHLVLWVGLYMRVLIPLGLGGTGEEIINAHLKAVYTRPLSPETMRSYHPGALCSELGKAGREGDNTLALPQTQRQVENGSVVRGQTRNNQPRVTTKRSPNQD